MVYVHDGLSDQGNSDFLGVIENYISLIWTDRYSTLGQFQLKLKFSPEAYAILTIGNLVQIHTSEYTKIIETIQVENSTIVVAGRDLTSLLDRRLVLQSELSKPPKLTDYIYELVSDTIGTHADLPERAIPWFISTFYDVEDFPSEKQRGYEQFKYGENLLEAIEGACKEVDLGFRVILTRPRFAFELYYRTDHTTYGPKVAFRADDGSIDNVRILQSAAQEKNVAYVRLPPKTGNGIGEIRKIIRNGEEWQQNLTRKEIWIDAASIRSEPGYTDAKRFDMMSVLAKRELTKDENEKIDVSDFDVSPTPTYKYQKDYRVGDIVLLTDGISGVPRRYQVREYVQTHAAGVTKQYPTLGIYDEREF